MKKTDYAFFRRITKGERLLIGKAEYEYFCNEDESAVIAWHRGRIHGFFVKPQERRKGIGTALLRELLREKPVGKCICTEDSVGVFCSNGFRVAKIRPLKQGGNLYEVAKK